MLFAAKITKPKYAPGIIDRPRLYRQLDRWQDHRAVVIHAPAGYGKSTLVSRWIDVSGLNGRSAWLSLEEDDRDPQQFVRYFAAALDRCLPGLLAAVQPILTDRQGSAQRALIRLLALLEENALPPSAVSGQHLLLVLDDLQRFESAELEALIYKMLEYGPDNLHLMLLARQRTELSLARLYAHGAILALTKQDLRFTEKEVQAYVQSQGFSATNPADVAQLAQRSEGWVSGLHLAVLSLRERGSMPALLSALQGDRDWLAEFLAEEVLDRQRPELRQFLLQTAILDGFNASLCTAVTGMNDAHAKLADITRADLFLIEKDSGGGWFRYHQLFQELLQQRLAAQFDAGAVADLHRRAGEWLAAAGQVRAALHHLLAAGAEEEAADLVESRMRKALVRDTNEAKRLFGLLPQRIWQQRPRLMLDRCFLALSLDDRQALHYVQQTSEILQAKGVTAENAPGIHGEWLVLSSGAHLIVNDFAATVSFARQAQSYMADLDDLAAGTLQFIQMHLRHNAGDHLQMLQFAECASAAYVRADFILGLIALERQVAKWSMDRGNSQEATRRFHALLDNPTQNRPEIVLDLLWANIFAAENSYWQNDLDQALLYQQTSLVLARQLQDNALILCSDIMGTIYRPDGQESTAQNLQVYTLHKKSASIKAFDLFLNLEIRRLTAAGHSEEAWTLAQQIGIDPAHTPTAYQHRSLIPYLRANINHGLDLPALTPLLAGAITYYVGIGKRFHKLQLLALTAWQQSKLQQTQRAVATLDEAVQLAQETGYVRVLLDIPELAGLLPQVDHKLDLVPSQKGKNRQGITLTAREDQVMKLLAAGWTYQQIADEMMIGLNTVRTHVRHIYEKLSVKKRIEAITVARRLGLLNDLEKFKINASLVQ